MSRLRSHTSRAIVLSHENFGEADRYIQLFSQQFGMITCLAKSARKSKKRYVGGLDLFCHIEVTLQGDPRGTAYLSELSVLNAFFGIRENISRVMAAGRCVQWVRRLSDAATPMPNIYSVLGQTLSLLERELEDSRIELLTLLFKLKLLSHLGLKPKVDACVGCGNPEEDEGFFDLEAGGILCRKCAATQTIRHRVFLPAEERVFLGHADRFRLTAWSEFDFPFSKTEPLSRLTTQFASFHSGAKLPN